MIAHLRTALVASLASLALTAPAFAAGTATGTLTINATVASSCGTSTNSPTLAFGTVTQTATAVPANTNITFVCANTVPYYVSISTGSCVNAGQPRMFLNSASCTAGPWLPYNLYTSAADSTAFPSTTGTPGAAPTGGIGTGLTTTVAVWGSIAAGTVLPAPGFYQDTATITVNY